jgi:hypothetical protein
MLSQIPARQRRSIFAMQLLEAIHGPIIEGRPSFRLVQRRSFNIASDIAAAATSTAQLVSATPLPLAAPNNKQAMRIVSGCGLIEDINQTHFLTCLGSSVVLSTDATLQVRRAWSANFGGVVLGANGIMIPINDPEWLFGQDYAEIGGLPQVQLNCLADISNSDAAAHNVHFRIVCIVEMYQSDPGFKGRR